VAASAGSSDERIQKCGEQDVMTVLDMARKEFNVSARSMCTWSIPASHMAR
jgi:hypothetical protein